MNNNTSKESPKQLSFADIDPEDLRPLPLIVSEKWNFPLAYYEKDNQYYFSVIDWIAGVGTSDRFRAADTWRKLQKELRISNPDDFATDKELYDIAQNMRATKQRPALQEIQDYLSKSGSAMDDWRLHPEKMLSVAQSRMMQDIERHEKANLGNRPEIVLLRSKLEATQTLAELKSNITKILAMTSKDWQNFHSAEIQALLGLTVTQLRKARDVKTSVRDSLNAFELNSLTYAERQLMAILSMQGAVNTQKLIDSVQLIFTPIGENLRALLETIGIDVLTGKPLLGSGE